MANLKKKIGCVALPFCLGLALSGAAGARELDLSGNWQFGKQKAGDAEGSIFNQGYTVAFGQQLTEMLDYSAHVAYRQFRRVGAADSDTLAPSMNVGLHNDIFNLDLLGSATESSASDNTDRNNNLWEIVWSSAWQKQFWPELRASYSEDRADATRAAGRSTDQKNTHTGMSADWGHRDVHLLYSYTGEDNMNKVSGAENTTRNHLARFETNRSFLDRRGTVSFSQQYVNTRNDFSTVPGPGGTALVPDTLLQTMSGNLLPPTSGSLTNSPGLMDRNFINGVVDMTGSLVLPQQHMNFGIEVMNSQRVDWVYLYTRDDLTNLPPPNNIQPATDFTWQLYIATDVTATTWQLVPTGLGTVIYNAAAQRFEIPIIGGVQVQFLKLVVASAPATNDSYSFTEIEAYRQITATGDRVRLVTDNKTYLTDFGLGFRFNPRWRMAYNFAMERGVFSEGNDLDRRVNSSSLIWDPNRMISSGLNVSETRTQRGTEPDDVGRSYGVNVTTMPLQTLDVNLGLTRTDNYKGGNLQSTTDSYDILTNAQLYRELDASLDLAYATTTSEITSRTTRNLGSNLRLTSRLTPAVTADFFETYYKALSSNDQDSGSTNFNVSWRLSDYLSLQGGGSLLWSDNNPDSTLLTTGVSLAPTPKTQVNFNYGYLDSTVTNHIYNLSWNLLLSRYLSLQTTGSYQDYQQQPDQWSVFLQLFARFSGM